ncbi:MAG TPA: FixH family protein [Steroidobacteraceae bacterium]|nr:FixH family protein [Steroidobacteraceae bacterium]
MSTVVRSAPWYRHFWPWFIIAMLSLAVTGSFVSLYFAVHTSDVVLEHADAAQ